MNKDLLDEPFRIGPEPNLKFYKIGLRFMNAHLILILGLVILVFKSEDDFSIINVGHTAIGTATFLFLGSTFLSIISTISMIASIAKKEVQANTRLFIIILNGTLSIIYIFYLARSVLLTKGSNNLLTNTLETFN